MQTPAEAPPRTHPATTLSGSRARRLRPPLVLALVVLGAVAVLHLRDPHRSGAYGFCPWLLLTGTSCPGCGGLRAVNDLSNGDLVAAASSNLLVVAAAPLAALAWVRSVAQRWRGALRPWPPARVHLLTAVLVGAAMVFWVVRNLPVGSWLAP